MSFCMWTWMMSDKLNASKLSRLSVRSVDLTQLDYAKKQREIKRRMPRRAHRARPSTATAAA